MWAPALLACRGPEPLTADELRDPAACAECHPDHVREWSASMHAYAGHDPVYVAGNARGQRETDGALGDFCVACHAPMAARDGLAPDGVLDDVPEAQRGVTCAFCHLADGVDEDHGNGVVLARDGVLRGPFDDPVPNAAHASRGSTLHDRDDPRSSALCGSCHDVVTPLGAHIERTYAEWRGSLFAKPGGLSCGACHLARRTGTAAADAGTRKVHDHGFPGVDVALDPFPADDPGEQARQADLVQELLDDTVAAYVCAGPAAGGTLAVVTLENVAAGHRFPSGVTSDRRVWVELTAWEGDRATFSTGVVPDGAAAGPTGEDPEPWTLWSTLSDVDGAPTFDFWAAAAIESGDLLPVQTTTDPSDPAWVDPHVSRSWRLPGSPDRIEVAVRAEPIGLEVLDALVASGDLDPAVRARMPRFTLGPTRVAWTAAAAVPSGDLGCVPVAPPAPRP